MSNEPTLGESGKKRWTSSRFENAQMLPPHLALSKPFVQIFYGLPGSGKSTLMNSFAEMLGLRALDLIPFVEPFVKQYGNSEVVGSRVKEVYDTVIEHLDPAYHDCVEFGMEFPEYVLPRVFAKVRSAHRQPVLVFCRLEVTIARARNRSRNRVVPTRALADQEAANRSGSFYRICEAQGVPIITVDTGGTFERSLSALLENTVILGREGDAGTD